MNKIELRDYQKDIIKRAIKSKGNILIQAPTGSGKTLIAEEIVKFHKDGNKKTLFIAPRINLLEQITSVFKNLNSQIIHGSNKKDIDLNTYSFVSTIQNNPNFRNEMLGEDIENQDYSSKFNLSLQKGLNKETQLKLAKSKEDSIKINLLKNYKSKEVFFACLDSIPSKNEQIKMMSKMMIGFLNYLMIRIFLLKRFLKVNIVILM